MAPLSPSNTPRFRIFYAGGGLQHSFQMRSNQSPASIGTAANAFLTALTPVLFSLVIDHVEFAPAGSDIFNPVVTGIEGNPYGAGASPIANLAWGWNFIGRTSGGRRVRVAVFSSTVLALNYRASAGEVAAVDAARGSLVANSLSWLGIDGVTPVWKTYANVKPFDHWVKELR